MQSAKQKLVFLISELWCKARIRTSCKRERWCWCLSTFDALVSFSLKSFLHREDLRSHDASLGTSQFTFFTAATDGWQMIDSGIELRAYDGSGRSVSHKLLFHTLRWPQSLISHPILNCIFRSFSQCTGKKNFFCSRSNGFHEPQFFFYWLLAAGNVVPFLLSLDRWESTPHPGGWTISKAEIN
jgi:hypothetical protein